MSSSWIICAGLKSNDKGTYWTDMGKRAEGHVDGGKD
jgi:hypothetical protein